MCCAVEFALSHSELVLDSKFADAEYLFEGALPDDAVLPRYQEKYLSSLNESGGAGVVRPEFNDLDNFKTYQKNWLKGYKEVPKPTSTQQVTRGPINWWDEPKYKKENPNFDPQTYLNNPIGNPSASRDIPEGMTPYIKVDDVTPNVKPSWKSQELPGLHISATMEGGPISKIIEPKTIPPPKTRFSSTSELSILFSD